MDCISVGSKITVDVKISVRFTILDLSLIGIMSAITGITTITSGPGPFGTASSLAWARVVPLVAGTWDLTIKEAKLLWLMLANVNMVDVDCLEAGISRYSWLFACAGHPPQMVFRASESSLDDFKQQCGRLGEEVGEAIIAGVQAVRADRGASPLNVIVPVTYVTPNMDTRI